MSRPTGQWGRRSLAATGVVVAACGLLAGCGGSSTPTTTTTVPPTTTTTALTPAQQSQLQPKLLTVADFPSGWKLDTAPNAVSTTGAPKCVGNLVLAKGSPYRASAAFVGPSSSLAAVIQTVAPFPSGTTAKVAKSLKAGFLACNGATLQLGGGQSAKLATGPVVIGPTGTGGFAAEMIISDGNQHEYLYVFMGIKGDLGTLLVWRSVDKSSALFAATAAKALAKL